MSAENIPAQLARKLLADTLPEMPDYDAHAAATEAQAWATLALVEEQRTANLLAAATFEAGATALRKARGRLGLGGDQ